MYKISMPAELSIEYCKEHFLHLSMLRPRAIKKRPDREKNLIATHETEPLFVYMYTLL